MKQRVQLQIPKGAIVVFYNYFKIIIVALNIIFALAIYIFVITPKINRIDVSKDEVSIEKQGQVDKQQSDIDKINIVVRSYNSMSSIDKDKIEKIIPPEPGVEELIGLMEFMIEARSSILARVDVVDVGKVEESKNLNRRNKLDVDEDRLPANVGIVKISLSIDNIDYQGLKLILGDFENSLRIFDIQSVSFSPREAGLEVNTYYFK